MTRSDATNGSYILNFESFNNVYPEYAKILPYM